MSGAEAHEAVAGEELRDGRNAERSDGSGEVGYEGTERIHLHMARVFEGDAKGYRPAAPTD